MHSWRSGCPYREAQAPATLASMATLTPPGSYLGRYHTDRQPGNAAPSLDASRLTEHQMAT